MQRSLFRFLATDHGKIAALFSGIVFLAVVGASLDYVVSQEMLRVDAQSTSAAWADTLLNGAADIPSMVLGTAPSTRTARVLNQSVLTGDIYRYRLWDRAGYLVASSSRMAGHQNPKSMIERCGDSGAQAVYAGSTCTVLDKGGPPFNPLYYACSYIPLRKNKAVVGVLEVYVDISAHRAFYQRSFLLVEVIIAVTVLLAGGIPALMVYRKMLAHRAAREEAQFLAEHDTLTGIANRKRIVEVAQAALAWSRRSQVQVAVILLDVDRFKSVNDGYGHAAGDELLRMFSARIAAAIREEDTVARLGGDEFVVLQVGVAQPDGAKALADRLLTVLTEPYEIGGTEIFCGASMGVAVAPIDASEWDRLLFCADAALYKAKGAGRQRVRFFHPGMEASLRDQQQLEMDLHRALDTGAFSLTYQPIFSFTDDAILGFEALLGWPPGWSPRSPKQFLPVAEKSGLMSSIGAWVLETACAAAAGWSDPLKLSVKLSPIQFRQGDIVATVQQALESSGLLPERLELGVTENLWIENTDAALDQLAELKELGVSIALDDFGAGYSSLKYLWTFPFNEVKIDRSFVEQMEADPKAAAVVEAIVALGKVLHVSVTAEGVNTDAQAEILTQSGCDHLQGFLFGSPLSASSTSALISADRPVNFAGHSFRMGGKIDTSRS